ncbi:Kunitz/Bovine pancreatic trypsin inhibitor domain protein [Ancylostoma caninum]|uniref:Kunitz/Bovine pancreatic trypsin inhibitor domain protein n=1 Tax=Ancylostoma caninum TaxID=29170 RepID=A0A368HBD2_ANCCA|nr:Kunitz/Bovine pancreatic trypsin inhibitor domain protein [Ancylostoma caninum]
MIFCGFYVGTVSSYLYTADSQQNGVKGQQQLEHGQQHVADPRCTGQRPPIGMKICRARLSRYYFDVEEKRCKKFNYDGCSGGPNNFATKDKCRRACMKSGYYYST